MLLINKTGRIKIDHKIMNNNNTKTNNNKKLILQNWDVSSCFLEEYLKNKNIYIEDSSDKNAVDIEPVHNNIILETLYDFNTQDEQFVQFSSIQDKINYYWDLIKNSNNQLVLLNVLQNTCFTKTDLRSYTNLKKNDIVVVHKDVLQNSNKILNKQKMLFIIDIKHVLCRVGTNT